MGTSQAILLIYVVFYLSLADVVHSSLGSAFAFDNTVLTKMVESGMYAMRPEIEISGFSSSHQTEEEQLDFLESYRDEQMQPTLIGFLYDHDPGKYIYFSNLVLIIIFS